MSAGPADEQIAALRTRLDRERAARRQAEDIAERATSDLYARQRELERVNADLQAFAFSASHDLVEPLRTIAGFAQLLQKRNRDQLDASGREFLGFIADGAARGQQLVSDLLEFSRASKPLEAEPVAVGDVLDAVLSELGRLLEDTGAVVEVAGPLATVSADRGLLSRVLANFVGNAAKYVAPGVAPRIRVATAPADDGMVDVSVADNGIGIAPDDGPRIFEPFVRVDPDPSRPGTGIGLSTSKRVAERHGGRVWVTPNDGGGSTFHATFPHEAEAPS